MFRNGRKYFIRNSEVSDNNNLEVQFNNIIFQRLTQMITSTLHGKIVRLESPPIICVESLQITFGTNQL